MVDECSGRVSDSSEIEGEGSKEHFSTNPHIKVHVLNIQSCICLLINTGASLLDVEKIWFTKLMLILSFQYQKIGNLRALLRHLMQITHGNGVII